MTMYVELLNSLLKKARKCYVLEPTIKGKQQWFKTITWCHEELAQCKGINQ